MNYSGLVQLKFNQFPHYGCLSLVQGVSLIFCGACSNLAPVALGGQVVFVLAIGPKVHWYNHGQGEMLLKGDKNP
jgi:hypothetical protein